MAQGYIKIHRKLCDWEWYQDANTFRLFMHLLLNANHREKKWQGLNIARGQIVTGRKVLSEQLNLSEKQIRLSMSKLENTGVVAIKRANKFSLVTIVKWDSYQIDDKKGPTTGPAEGQQRATNKNVNNINNNTAESETRPMNENWLPNDLNKNWLSDSGLSEFEQQRVIRDFKEFWIQSRSKKKNWDLAFRRNPLVNRAVNGASAKPKTDYSEGLR